MIDNDDIFAGFGCLEIIIVTIAMIIFSPFIDFILCYFTGWLIKITFGNAICSGLLLLGINVSLNQLPLLFGTLGVIGSFFKSTSITRKSDEDKLLRN